MYIIVKVYPSAKEDKIIKTQKDKYEVCVKEPKQQGLANKATCLLLAAYLKVPLHKLRLIKGARQQNKTFELLP